MDSSLIYGSPKLNMDGQKGSMGSVKRIGYLLEYSRFTIDGWNQALNSGGAQYHLLMRLKGSSFRRFFTCLPGLKNTNWDRFLPFTGMKGWRKSLLVP